MKETYWGYWIVLLGIFVIGVMLLVNNTTTGTTQDYYLLKEVTQSSMVDALDYSYYRLYGDVKMSKAKFVENFIRRFSESSTLAKSYTVSFYDIYEVPPKASVMVTSNSGAVNVANESTNFDLVNKLDVILVGGVNANNSNSSAIKYKVCNIDFTPEFYRDFIENNAKGEGNIINKTSYPYLYDYYTNYIKKGTYNKKAFVIAMTNQFPELESSTKEELISKDPLLRKAFEENYIIILGSN